MIQYGLISKVDASVIEKTLDLIMMKEFIGEEINTCQIGVFDGETDRGIYSYVTSKQYGTFCAKSDNMSMQSHNYKCNHTSIDNQKDKPILKPFPECTLIIGNSNEVYNQLEDGTQHFIFIDGCHAFPMVISDFFCYESKVKVGGYLAFHDTGFHIAPYKDYQRMGDEKDLDFYICVRKALGRIGLLDGGIKRWKKVFDEQDLNDTAGGICCFKKLF